MEDRNKGFLSAKIKKSDFIKREYIDNSNNKLQKRNKFYNLSLNINDNNKERIYGLVSPKNKNKYYNTQSPFLNSFSNINNLSSLNKKKKFRSLSSKNIFSTINGRERKTSAFPSVSTHRGLVKSPSAVNHHIYNSRFFKIEDEKLSQEIYYLKKDIHLMNKKLKLLGIENKEKDIILTEKENEINSIINKNFTNTGIDEIISDETKDNNYYILNTKNEENQDVDYFNRFNLKLIFYDISLSNYNYNNLFIRIRRQILKTFKEIEEIEEQIKENKKSIFFTKMNEIDLESSLYKQQINKINILINNAMEIYERNQKKLKVYEMIENKLMDQEKVLSALNIENELLQNEEYLLNENINKIKNILVRKNNRKLKNFNLINNLNNKNEILSKDKIILEQYDIKKMSQKIKDLKKSVGLYKFNYKLSNNDISQLKKKKEEILKDKKINLKLNPKNKTFSIKHQKYDYNINKKNLNIKVQELSKEYDKKKNYEKLLYQELKKFEKQFKEIMANNNEEEENPEINNDNMDNNDNNYNKDNNDNNNDIINNNIINEKDNNQQNTNNFQENEEDSEKAIKNEINEDNPYYSGEESNIPEETNKFNKSQFINFEYILFKNFEAKNILLNESKNKIIDPFINIISQKNIKEIKYNNDSFNLIINELTKIIMNVLENVNQKNKKLISIFIGAIMHISNYDINKLIRYINLLFNYTNNYSIKE